MRPSLVKLTLGLALGVLPAVASAAGPSLPGKGPAKTPAAPAAPAACLKLLQSGPTWGLWPDAAPAPGNASFQGGCNKTADALAALKTAAPEGHFVVIEAAKSQAVWPADAAVPEGWALAKSPGSASLRDAVAKAFPSGGRATSLNPPKKPSTTKPGTTK